MKLRNKQILSILLIISILFSGTLVGSNTTYAAAFGDVTGHWAEPFINAIKPLGVIAGYEDGTFRPESDISRIEFIAIAVNSLDKTIRTKNTNEFWGTPYIEVALDLKLITESEFGGITEANLRKNINREEMASIVVRSFYSTGATISAQAIQEASQALTDFNTVSTNYHNQAIAAVALGIINGFPNSTFGPLQNASRAEAAAVSQKLLVEMGTLQTITINPSSSLSTAFAVNGIEIGDTYDYVIQKFGSPIREDASEYGFKWLIYHAQYKNYFQIGVKDNRVVSLFTASNLVTSKNGYQMNLTKDQVNNLLGSPLNGIVKGNSEYLQYNNTESTTYFTNNMYVTTYYDTANGGKAFATKIVSYATEQAFKSQFGTASDALRIAYEKELFDLTNVYRVSFNLPALKWSEPVATVARKHSQDMAVRKFFNHVNPSGYDPFERITADGIDFTVAAENIAAGYTNAFSAHTGWINSPGHRENLVRDIDQIGIGVYFGGDYLTYYTQDFITP